MLRKRISKFIIASLFTIPVITVQHVYANDLEMNLIARYDSNSGEGGTEIVTYSTENNRVYVVNGAEKSLDILDLNTLGSGANLQNIELLKRVSLQDISPNGAGDITSVTTFGDYVAVTIVANNKTDNGMVCILDLDGNILNSIAVGALPDMLTFTPDGTKILVANEGEPSDDYLVDPEGSVSIIDLSYGINNINVSTATFEDVYIEDTVRKSKNDSTYSEDLEPEYIAISEDGKKAYVTLQESNAIGVLDIESCKFEKVFDLGVKDWSINSELDASDVDGNINFSNYPILGMYQPDTISSINMNGNDYIIVANEGDAKSYSAYDEEVRVSDIVDNIQLDADNYEGYTQDELSALVENGLFNENNLGRLKVTLSDGMNDDGVYEALYAFGGRSFSIFNADDMSLVYDSGDDFSKIIANIDSQIFNNDEGIFDGRSDDKGAEPEGLAIGTIDSRTYAFIGLERTGGIFVYDITNPDSASYVTYFTTTNYDNNDLSGDISPEGLYFISEDDSPTGSPILLASHEISGTLAVIEINTSSGTSDSNFDNNINDNIETEINDNLYVVQEGDNLYRIAINNNTTYEKLVELNNIQNPTLIFPNDTLILY